MAANNIYLGMTMGQSNDMNIGNIVGATSVNAGPAQGIAADVELRIQTDPGTGPNGIKIKDVVQGLYKLIAYLESRGPDHAGTFTPAL